MIKEIKVSKLCRTQKSIVTPETLNLENIVYQEIVNIRLSHEQDRIAVLLGSEDSLYSYSLSGLIIYEII